MGGLDGGAAALPAGVTIGHWTDPAARTGCTVVLAPDGATAAVDVRGAAPGTRETDALRPGTLVDRAHAVLLAGGSAFGLDAAGGVMRYLEERGKGFEVGPVRVPIVAGAVLFDLLTGDPAVRPDAAAGYAACQAAGPDPAAAGLGAVGAGTGATVAKAGGAPPAPGGLGVASARAAGVTVTAILVANGIGGIWDDDRHEWIAPLTAPAAGPAAPPGPDPGGNTTIGVVVTDAALTREQATRVAVAAHDGIARAVRPAHTRYDGDTMFCLATGTAGPAGPDPGLVEVLAAELTARAIASGVRAAAGTS
ncbi:MAG: P1 family peptidase [Gemmatimonadota bacterium]